MFLAPPPISSLVILLYDKLKRNPGKRKKKGESQLNIRKAFKFWNSEEERDQDVSLPTGFSIAKFLVSSTFEWFCITKVHSNNEEWV